MQVIKHPDTFRCEVCGLALSLDNLGETNVNI